MVSVASLSNGLGYPDRLPGNCDEYWRNTEPTSGHSVEQLTKADLEELAERWLNEAGNGERNWPTKPRSKRQTWGKDKNKITGDIKLIFVKKWQKWVQNQKAAARNGGVVKPVTRVPLDQTPTSTPASKPSKSPAKRPREEITTKNTPQKRRSTKSPKSENAQAELEAAYGKILKLEEKIDDLEAENERLQKVNMLMHNQVKAKDPNTAAENSDDDY